MTDLPDPTTVRTDPCPDGFEYQWVPEPVFGWLAWRVVDQPKRCRDINHGVRCIADSVAVIQRGRKREQWWHYCADHMFGRKVNGRRVWVIHTVPTKDNR
jgi:hypothetical protein